MALFFRRNIPLIMARTVWSPVILWSAGVKLRIQGKELMEPQNSHPVIVVSNHSSFLDIPIICRCVPVNLHFTAKTQIKKLPLFGLYMMATGMIFIDRSNKQKAIQSIDTAAVLIRNGKNVLIYPEGKRSTNGQIARFKKGAFHLAIKSGADIVPVAISGAARVWPKSGKKLKPGIVNVYLGKRIPSTDYKAESVNEFAQTTRRIIEGMMP